MKVSNVLFLFCAIALITFTASCNRNAYIVQDFETTTTGHQEIAVLPFEIIFTGIKPKKLSSEEFELALERDSEVYQNNYYNQILRSGSGRRSRNLDINIQPQSVTTSILEDNGISIRESWEMKPSELAQILGVEAVVRGRIEQNRLMSDAASFGIDIGTQVLGTILNAPVFIPGRVANNKRVRATYQLVNQGDSRLLWSTAYTCEADWSQSEEQVVAQVNSRSARNFPYRIGR